MSPEIERARAWAGQEIDRAGDQPGQPERFEQSAHWQILAVGHEMRLGVAADDLAPRIESGDGIVGADRAAAFDFEIDRTGQQ